MKRIFYQFLVCYILFSSSNLFAQKIDTVSNQNGQVCFKYPFEIRTYSRDVYFIDFKFKKYKKLLQEMYQTTYTAKDDLSYKEFSRNIKSFLKQVKHKNKGLDYQLKKAVIHNPFPLIEPRYSLEMDVKPCLDKIPDGVYIQYFAPFFYLNKDGSYTLKKDLIAGKFTIKNNMLEGEACWFNAKGDTLKHGFYKNGLKDGLWKLEQRELRHRMYTKEFRHAYITNGSGEV